ncbi:linoleoyl-CoA desaturase [Litorivivens lipolytica]|uniref:Linoleoyl-CoA desaturase n=1 Tax=Litorivivens lipolytica TaxID=1524264 RepID=A0A7W4W7D3_9GAMM|nr:acyl-CoA desaturase [Litorivivens lipolytica]MBB3048284.1 linoleoyl-CoA desaturase [Litorivivens lipolytica]
MTSSLSRALSSEEVARLGEELDALKQRTLADVGEADARYIRRVVKAVRYTELLGRALLFVGIFPPAWVLGTLLLGVSKILENMELGHNVMHGQYDWMNEPSLNGKTYEWDIVGTSDMWRKTHNYEHHTYTNIRGMDNDIGYGLLRLFPEQRWRPFYLLQPLWAALLALLFQWGVAIQDLELGKVFSGRKSKAELNAQWQPLKKKIRYQLLKDYLFFPLLAGPFFLTVLSGNLVANLIRNLWTFMIIFCGHFTAKAEVFPRSVLDNETQGHWYLRQLRGSSNLRGSKLFHILSGNLSHQIEHHLFPTVPARRYRELSVEVKAICEKYGQHYNTGSLLSQFGQVVYRIFRHALPSRPERTTALLSA